MANENLKRRPESGTKDAQMRATARRHHTPAREALTYRRQAWARGREDGAAEAGPAPRESSGCLHVTRLSRSCPDQGEASTCTRMTVCFSAGAAGPSCPDSSLPAPILELEVCGQGAARAGVSEPSAPPGHTVFIPSLSSHKDIRPCAPGPT